MKLKPKQVLMNPFFACFILMQILIACQKEFIDTREPDRSVTITAGDHIADLILKVVLKDGSYDNIIDGCNEISIEFPYSILIDDQQYDIDSQEDIESIKMKHFFELDDIEIVYPITISFSDYSERILSDPDELEEIQEQYDSEFDDEDIECIDFVYPVELAFYNTVRQITDVVTMDNDAEMYSIFKDINDLIIEISFPVALELSDSQRISVDDNYQLEDEITRAMDDCDEEDEVEFSDEDHPLVDLITTDVWYVSFYADTSDETSSFTAYTFNFDSDFSVRANTTALVVEGAWEVDADDNSIFLELDFDTDEPPLVWLNHEWMISNVSTTAIELETESDFDGYTKRLNLIKSE